MAAGTFVEFIGISGMTLHSTTKNTRKWLR
jgi:hypothetical protein